MRFAKILIFALAATGLSLSACNSSTQKGPAERAGEKVDKGMSKLGEKMQEGGEELQDKAHGD
jgi:predicted small secreted protein